MSRSVLVENERSLTRGGELERRGHSRSDGAARRWSPAPTAASASRPRRALAAAGAAGRDGGPQPGEGGGGRGGNPPRSAGRVAGARRARPRLAGVGARGCRADPRRHEAVDILVNNAGVMGDPRARDRRRVRDAVRCRPPRALGAHRAADARAAARGGGPDRHVTSTAHHMGRAVDPGNPHLHGRYGPWRAYGQAKLANFHFGLGLHATLDKAGARAASLIAHPGLSNTDLQAVSVAETDGGFSRRFFHSLAGSTGMAPAQGALSQLRAATDPGARGGRVLRPALRQQRPAGAQADPAASWDEEGDRPPLGGIRAGNRPEAPMSAIVAEAGVATATPTTAPRTTSFWPPTWRRRRSWAPRRP